MSNQELKKLYVDENVVRIIAALVVVITLVTLITQWKWMALILAADFALRAFTYLPAPLAAIAKTLARSASLKSRPIFAAPKKFAALLGFIFSLAVYILLFFHQVTAAYVAGGILIACAVLESVFKICLGCYVYDWVVAPWVNRKYQRSNKNNP